MGIYRSDYWNADSAADGASAAVAQLGPIDVTALGVVEQSTILAGGTVLLAILVLGLVPSFGNGVVDTSRRSPIISICLGLPSAFALLSMSYMGTLIAETNLGVFFAIPLIAISATPLVMSTAVGFVAIGGFVATRLGLEGRWSWVLVGAPLSGLAVLYPPVGLALVALAASLGVGAGARVAFNGGGPSGPEERVVPPANKV